ncbi:hypothetical protein [Helicobacter cinaedi]|uniref:hypothetical protein n=1 Tax=Helicobacter cinaedi TaxID=213 RepID=UPI0018A3CCD1|nr:hypothetical protein [Helicobacter cinaedi]QOQ95430.1 hypothetical protein HW245_07145 [Helicobacter cinaedi]
MPIKTTNLNYEEFYNKLLSLLILVEDKRQYVYTDSVNVVTIGIGVNVEEQKWRNVILMYKVGILQYTDLENGVYTLANILGKQSQSMQTLINTTSKEIKDKINEYRDNKNLKANSSQEKIKNNVETIQNLQKDLNTILQNNIKIYNKNPENTNQKLNENMVFELTDNEAKEIKKIISFEKMYNLRNRLQKWNANYLTSFSKTESINPQEFIPLLSIYYQRPARFNPESGLILLQKALKDKNRFLAWFSVRYYADIRQFKNPYYSRRIQEAAMFGLNNKDSNNQIEYFSTSLDIFSCLNFNFKEANTKQGLGLPDTYTYLSFMQTYKECKEIDETAKNLLKEYNIYHTKDKHYYSYVGKDEFQDITNILSPYLDYLNTLTQKTFSLENIYCIQSFYGVLGAHKLDNVASINKILSQRFSNNSKQPQPTTQDSTAQANPAQSTNENPTQILILYPKATPLPIQIIQPENTFLTLVVGKNAKLDCSKLPLDKCEIHYLQYDENQEESTENPKITALKTDSELTLTTKDSNLYEVIHNGIIYYISKNEGVLRVALGQNREEVIELYNFAKENKYKILKESHSQILDIQLKLQDNKELPTSHNGNFALTINNLTLLDKNGKNLDIAEDYTLYLHNCENRIIYENTSIQKNTDDTYRVNFSFDLIQDEDSNFFKRTTKLIIATQNLSNDFSTSEIHTKGNVAVVSLSSADKKGGNYTFTKKVSAQEFGEEIKTIYIDNDNPKAYQEQIDDSKKKLNIINIKAYSDKEQTNEIDTCDSETTIFVRAILNEEDRVFYDETIHWAYYIKGASEDLNKIDRDKIKQMENIEGNDIIFSLDMLAEDDKEILLKSLQNNSQKYELILFAYFKKPAIKVGNNITSIVLSMKTSQSMSSPTSPFTLNIKDYLCLTSP